MASKTINVEYDAHIQSTATTWATARSGNGLSVVAANTTIQVRADQVSSSDWRVNRAFLMFNTSSLGSGAKVNTCSLVLNCQRANGSRTVNIYGATPASNTVIATSDWGNIGTTAFASAQTISSTGAKTFTLNASGIANINPTGYSRFSIRNSSDYDNSAPSNDGSGDPQFYALENGSNYGYLSINYTPGPAGSPLLFGGGVTIA
jgi:hypothetical protein